MSEAALRDLASKLDTSLKKNSEEYRAIVSDFMPHIVKIDETEIKKDEKRDDMMRLFLDYQTEMLGLMEEKLSKDKK